MKRKLNLILALLLGFVTGFGTHAGWEWTQETIHWHRFQKIRLEINAEIVKLKASLDHQPTSPEWKTACDFLGTAIGNACHEPGSTSEHSLERFRERLREHAESSPRNSALIKELWTELRNVSPHAFRYTVQFQPLLDEILISIRE